MWAAQAVGKANTLADAFLARWELPAQVQNEFSAPPAELRVDDGFLLLRARNAKQRLASPREDSATGPDLLPARVLRRR
eukprot:9145883-Alexandrium_andersonii.AAC.1